MATTNGFTDGTVPASGFNSTESSSGSSAPEEVGWYFVEQYYTTLHENPSRVHLFYNKNSTLAWGDEGATVDVVRGRPDIKAKIESLKFNNCKVRVTNVDSMASINDSIFVQVLGQMTNNGEPNRRYSQSFFLAQQPGGYYVLNDILRYLKEDDEDELYLEDEAPAEGETLADAVVEPVKEAAEAVKESVLPDDKKEEVPAEETPAEAEVSEPEPIAEINGTKSEPEVEPEAEEKPVEKKLESVAEQIASAPLIPAVPSIISTTSTKTEETPATIPPPAPEQKAVAPTKEEKPAAPPAPAKPAAPRTWANLLATGAKNATAAASAPVVAQVAPAKDTPKDGANNATLGNPSSGANPAAAGGWQTTDSTRRQNRPVSTSGPPQNQVSAYIKNVTERVDPVALREALSKYGTIKLFEISKPRNCAFVDFTTPAEFAAAAAGNPHRIGDQTLFVEERKPRTGANAPFAGNRGGPQGPRGDRGGRGGFQRSGTGGFESGRGGFDGPRGGNSMGGRQNSGRGNAFPRGGGRGGAAAGAAPAASS